MTKTGYHSICIIRFDKGKSENPRGVIGLVDVSARKHVDKDILSFSVPFNSNNVRFQGNLRALINEANYNEF